MKICEAGRDPCGCNNWSKGIRTINGQYPDDNRDFDIVAGDGIEVSPATAGIEISVKAPLPGPMVYRGTVGTGGTVASLPDANADNIGWTYVALTAGSTPDDTPKTYQIGDMLISNGEEWTVVAAGDDPYVTLDTAQTITGTKTFATTGDNVIIGMKNTDKYNVAPSSNKFNVLQYKDSDDVEQARIDFYHITNGSKYIRQRIKAENGTEKNLSIVVDANGNGYAQAPSRAYNSANVDDIVTIGSLASNPNVVHTSNNENIFGIKLFENDVKKRTNLPNLTTTTGTYLGKIIFTAVDNSIAGELRFLQSNGERAIYVGVNDTSGNTTWVKLIGVTL